MVGRKGLARLRFFTVRDHVRPDRNQIVLDLKPEGYQLPSSRSKFSTCSKQERASTQSPPSGYLLLLEVAYKILRRTAPTTRTKDL